MLPHGKVFEMVTVDAARAVNAASTLGSLEVGKAADIVLVNLRAPHLAPMNSMPLEHVICFANGGDVDTVVCAGKVLMHKRRVLSVDEGAVIERATVEAAKARARLGGLADLRRRRDGFWGSSRYA